MALVAVLTAVALFQPAQAHAEERCWDWVGMNGAAELIHATSAAAAAIAALGPPPQYSTYSLQGCTISGDFSNGQGQAICDWIFSCAEPGCVNPHSWTTQTLVWQQWKDCDADYFLSGEPQDDQIEDCPTCMKDVVGDPINPVSGSVLLDEGDISTALIGLSFNRFYNSGNPITGDLGVGWRHSYSRSIQASYVDIGPKTYLASNALYGGIRRTPALACTAGFDDIKTQVPSWANATADYGDGWCRISAGGVTISTAQVFLAGLDPTNFREGNVTPKRFLVTRDDGQTLSFINVVGAITAPAGVNWELFQTYSGFILKLDNGDVESYDTEGRLLSVQTLAHGVYSMGWDGSGRLTSVTDPFGHTMTLAYSSGRLSSVTDPASHSVQYAYDSSGRLSTVTNVDSTIRTYVYENTTFPDLLTGRYDESTARRSTWTYDSQGHGASTSEAGGANAVSLVYHSNGSVTVTDALGAVRTFSKARAADAYQITGISGSQCPTCREGLATTYDNLGHVSSRTDYNGHITTYAYDTNLGLETSRTEAYGTPNARTITTQWDTSTRLPVQIAEPNRTTDMVRDGYGNLLTRTVTDSATSASRTWTYTYDGYGHVLTEDGPRTDVNDTTTYTYYSCTSGNACGQLETLTNALGQVTTFNTYNANGQPLTMTDPNGVVTTLTYDNRQHLASRQAGTETTAFEYWPTGLLKRATLPDATYVEYTYDNAHRLSHITDGLGNHIDYTLDAMGNRTAEETHDPSSVLTTATSRVFNQLGLLAQQIGSAGTSAVTTSFAYDSNGNQTNIDAPLSRSTVNQYDELNRLKQVTDPANGGTLFSYDANDNLTGVTDPTAKVTSYQYNGLGDLTTQTSPVTGVTTNTYDSGGNLNTSTDARSAVATYSYDVLNRVSQIAYGDQTIGYTYDSGTHGKGRLTGASDADHSMSWQYDAQGRVTSKSQTVDSVTHAVGYAYTNGDLTTLTTPSGQSVVYAYSNGRPTSITINGTGLLSAVTYEPFGAVRSWTWTAGGSEIRLHDTDGNPSAFSGVESTSYNLDNAFRITGISNASNATLSWTYGYDGLDRLTSAANGTGSLGWSYDANGNRSGQTGGPAPSYAANSISFLYNNRNRMVSAITSGATGYYYNALGQRIKKAGLSSTTLYVYDEAGHLLGEYTSSGGLIQETVWLDDMPVATLRPHSGGGIDVYAVHTDHLNTPRLITRTSDNVIVWRWDADPFGTAAANEDPSGLGAFSYNLRFPGQYFDVETGLSYNYMRDYDAQAGRYIESDPIGQAGGINPYAYTGSNPIGGIDPLGLATLVITSGSYIGNPAGHTALAFTGQGVYSYGTSSPYGSDTTSYIQNALASRSVTITTLNTTPEQEQAMANLYNQNYPKHGGPKYSVVSHDCATAALDALGNIKAIDQSILDMLFNPEAPMLPFLPFTVEAAAALQPGATTVTLPKGSTVPASLNSYNPTPH